MYVSSFLSPKFLYDIKNNIPKNINPSMNIVIIDHIVTPIQALKINIKITLLKFNYSLLRVYTL